jgi:hypothetical protein
METNNTPRGNIGAMSGAGGTGGAAAPVVECASPPPPGAIPAIALSGVWSLVGFVGASVLAGGLQFLIGGVTRGSTVLALVVGGGIVATLGWRGAWKALQAYDRVTVPGADALPLPPVAARRYARDPVRAQIAYAVPPAAFAAR